MQMESIYTGGGGGGESFLEDVPLVELCILYLLACQGDSGLFLLCLCDVFRVLINSLVCWIFTGALGLVLFETVTIHSEVNM